MCGDGLSTLSRGWKSALRENERGAGAARERALCGRVWRSIDNTWKTDPPPGVGNNRGTAQLRSPSVVGMGASHHQSALQPVSTNPYLPSTRFELPGCNPSKQLHTSVSLHKGQPGSFCSSSRGAGRQLGPVTHHSGQESDVKEPARSRGYPRSRADSSTLTWDDLDRPAALL